MNQQFDQAIETLLIDTSDADIEKLAVAIIKKCAELNDEWKDSGRFATFGDRLKAHFGVE